MALSEWQLQNRFNEVKTFVDDQQRKRIAPSDDNTRKLRNQILQLNDEFNKFMQANDLHQLPEWARIEMPKLLEYSQRLYKIKNSSEEVERNYDHAKKLYTDFKNASDEDKAAKKELVLTVLTDAMTGFENLKNDNPMVRERESMQPPDDLAAMIESAQNWSSQNSKPQPVQMGQPLRQPLNNEVEAIKHESIDTLNNRIQKLFQVNPNLLSNEQRLNLLLQAQAIDQRLLQYINDYPKLNNTRIQQTKKQIDAWILDLREFIPPHMLPEDLVSQQKRNAVTLSSGIRSGDNTAATLSSAAPIKSASNNGMTPYMRAMQVLDATDGNKSERYAWQITTNKTALTQITNHNIYSESWTDEKKISHIRDLERMLLAYYTGRDQSEIGTPIIISGDDSTSRAILMSLCQIHRLPYELQTATEPVKEVALQQWIKQSARTEFVLHTRLITDLPYQETFMQQYARLPSEIKPVIQYASLSSESHATLVSDVNNDEQYQALPIRASEIAGEELKASNIQYTGLPAETQYQSFGYQERPAQPENAEVKVENNAGTMYASMKMPQQPQVSNEANRVSPPLGNHQTQYQPIQAQQPQEIEEYKTVLVDENVRGDIELDEPVYLRLPIDSAILGDVREKVYQQLPAETDDDAPDEAQAMDIDLMVENASPAGEAVNVMKLEEMPDANAHNPIQHNIGFQGMMGARRQRIAPDNENDDLREWEEEPMEIESDLSKSVDPQEKWKSIARVSGVKVSDESSASRDVLTEQGGRSSQELAQAVQEWMGKNGDAGVEKKVVSEDEESFAEVRESPLSKGK